MILNEIKLTFILNLFKENEIVIFKKENSD